MRSEIKKINAQIKRVGNNIVKNDVDVTFIIHGLDLDSARNLTIAVGIPNTVKIHNKSKRYLITRE